MDWLMYAGIGAAGGLILGWIVGVIIYKSSAKKQLGSAESQAKKILEDAIKNAESAKKESLLSAKESIIQMIISKRCFIKWVSPITWILSYISGEV